MAGGRGGLSTPLLREVSRCPIELLRLHSNTTPLPQPLATTHPLSVSMDLPILDISRKCINSTQYVTFCDWFLSLSTCLQGASMQ